MSQAFGAPIDSEQIAASYEELRGLMLRGAGRGVGFAVFVRHGMAAWVAACAAATPQPRPKPTSPPTERCSQLPDELRHELATLMAHMALSSHIHGAITV